MPSPFRSGPGRGPGLDFGLAPGPAGGEVERRAVSGPRRGQVTFAPEPSTSIRSAHGEAGSGGGGYSPAEMSVPMDVIPRSGEPRLRLGVDPRRRGARTRSPPPHGSSPGHRASTWARPSSRWGPRAPACAAMTAMTLDAMSGRAVHPRGGAERPPRSSRAGTGVPYGRPLTRTREYISIIRKILARKEPLTHEGEHYQIPYRGEGRVRARKAAPEHPARQPRASHLHRGVHRERPSHRAPKWRTGSSRCG